MYKKNINEIQSKIGEWQKKRIIDSYYTKKLMIVYKGELKKPGKGLMFKMAWQLSNNYQGIVSIVVDERRILFLTNDKDNVIKKTFGSKNWTCEIMETNSEEQIRLIEDPSNDVYMDKSLYNQYMTIKDMVTETSDDKYNKEEFNKNNKQSASWSIIVYAVFSSVIVYGALLFEPIFDYFYYPRGTNESIIYEYEQTMTDDVEFIVSNSMDDEIVKVEEISNNKDIYPNPNQDAVVNIIQEELKIPEYELTEKYYNYRAMIEDVSDSSSVEEDVTSLNEMIRKHNEENNKNITDEEILKEVEKNVKILNEIGYKSILQETIENEERMQRQVFYKCENVEDYTVYENMVKSGMMDWNDALIKVNNWNNHDELIREIIHESLIKDYTDEQIADSIAYKLLEWGYSKDFIEGTVNYYMSHFEEDISIYNASKHLFTAKDKEMELNPSEEYKEIINKAMGKYLNDEIELPQLIQRYQIIMIKQGYSNAFIEYTINAFIRTIMGDQLDISEEE